MLPVNNFYTAQSLSLETMANWAQITKEVPKDNFKLGAPKAEIKKGFEAYEAARKSNIDLIILGGPKIRENEKLLVNFGTLATDTQYDQKKMKRVFTDLTGNQENSAKASNNGAINKVVKEHLHRGSVMFDSNWWIYRNDMFMIGAIHGGRSFHLVEKRGQIPADDLLWDAKEKRPRVLGRELIMLQLAGYQRVKCGDSLGIVLAPPVNGPNLVTLTECRAKIAQVKSVDEIKAIFSVIYSNDCAREIENQKAPAANVSSIR